MLHDTFLSLPSAEKFNFEAESLGSNGEICGYASVFNNVNHYGSFMAENAFDATIEKYKRENKNIAMYINHNDDDMPVGFFDVDLVKIDKKGLFVTGSLNLNFSEGAKALYFIQNKVFDSFSVSGITSSYDSVTDSILGFDLQEISLTEKPADQAANITDLLSVTAFKDFALAPQPTPTSYMTWKASVAINRVREYSNSDKVPSASYKNYFFWYDSEDAKNFGAYKFPFVDIINGKPYAMQRAIFSAAQRLIVRTGATKANIPDADRNKMISHINRYFKKMKMDSPFTANVKKHYSAFNELFLNNNAIVEEISNIRDVEDFFQFSVGLTSNCSKHLISKIKTFLRDAKGRCNDEDTALKMLKDIYNITK